MQKNTQHSSSVATDQMVDTFLPRVASEVVYSTDLERLYSAIVESSDDAIIAKKLDGTIIAWNTGAERLYGFTAQEAIGSSIEIIVPEDRRDEVWTMIERIRNGERLHHFETVRLHKDRHMLDVSLTASPVWSATGTIACVSVIARDISERKRTEQIFRTVVEASPNGLIMVDSVGNIALVNAEAERQFGYTRSELLGQPVDLLVPSLLRDAHSSHREQFTTHPEARVMGAGRDLYGLRKDGSEFPIEIGLNPIQSGDGLHVLSAIVDISKRTQAEAAMRETERKLSTLVDLLPIGVAVLNADSKVIYSNPALDRIVGMPHNQLLSGAYQRRQYVRSDGAPMEDADFASTRAQNEHNTVYDVETGIIREDGGLTWTNVSAVPVNISDWRVVIVTSDITERKQNEDQLIYQACLLENISDVIIATDLNFIITRWNEAAEQLYGWTPEEACGKYIGELVHTEYVDTTAEQVREAFVTNGTWRGEAVQYHREGRPINILSSVSLIKDAVGRPIGAVAVNRDITERKRVEQELVDVNHELRRSNADLEQFAYIASHDLQEPLRMVASYTELLSERYSGKLDAKADKFIAYAVDGARRMQQLVNDLLSYSRVGTQGKPLVPTDSAFILRRVIEGMQSSIRESGAQIEYGVLPIVLADAVQLGQIFQNLISNAIKFRAEAPPNMHISATRLADASWQFALADNGIGIDADQAQRIFQIFQRLHERGTYPGSGIGLAIAKRIVERHCGHIWFDSEPGHGSTFYFTLPSASAQAKKAQL